MLANLLNREGVIEIASVEWIDGDNPHFPEIFSLGYFLLRDEIFTCGSIDPIKELLELYLHSLIIIFLILDPMHLEEGSCFDIDVSKFTKLLNELAFRVFRFSAPSCVLCDEVMRGHLEVDFVGKRGGNNVDGSNSRVYGIEEIDLLALKQLNLPYHLSLARQNMDHFAVYLLFLFAEDAEIHSIVMQNSVSMFAFNEQNTLVLFTQDPPSEFRAFSKFYPSFEVQLLPFLTRLLYLPQRNILIINILFLFATRPVLPLLS